MNVKFLFIVFLSNLLIENINSDNYNNSTEDSDQSDDYYDNQTDITNDQCHSDSFLTRFETLHKKAKSVHLVNNVESVEQTIDVLKNFGNNFNSLVSLSKRDKYMLLEFFTKNDLGLSPKCFAAYHRLYKAFNNYDLWALKCKLIFL